MYEASDVIIISDLHMAAERGRGLFQSDKGLTAFLAWVLEEPSTLLLNGDTFDFMILEDGASSFEPFAPEGAARRICAIAEHHDGVFEALGKIARSAKHQLVILGGNHDPELVMSPVQRELEKRLANTVPGPPIRWLVQGQAENLDVGGVRTIIEHGDLYDDWNRIAHNALRDAMSLASRGLAKEHKYREPPGTRIVVDHVAALREEYPWIELLKPLREAVFPIMAAVISPAQARGLLETIDEVMAWVTRSIVRRIRGWLNPARRYRAASAEAGRQKFIDWLQRSLHELTTRTVRRTTFSSALIKRLRKVAEEDGYFDVTAHDAAYSDVEFLIERGTDLIVHGHTHAAKAYPVGNGLYMNTGTWTRLLQLPEAKASDADWRSFLEGLRAKSATGFLRPTFVRITANSNGSGATASLQEWSPKAPNVLERWSFEPSGRTWTREG